MKKTWIFTGILLLALLSACQAAPGTQEPFSTSQNDSSSMQGNPQSVIGEHSGASAPGYSQALGLALAKCDQMGLNQACYGSGQVEMAFLSGEPSVPFAKPGDNVDLAGVSTIAVHTSHSTQTEWGLILLKLQADFERSDQALTLAALGDVEIRQIHTEIPNSASPTLAITETAITDSSGSQTEVALSEPLQEVDFASIANSAQDDGSPNGLLVWTPPGDDLASVKINGATITLGSMALIETAGDFMTVSMIEGSAIVQVGEDSGFVTTSNQISIPVDSTGIASGAPGPSTVIDPRAKAISDAVSQYAPDPRAAAIANAIDQYPSIVVRDIARRFNRAINRCTNSQSPDPHYVYNTLYYYNRMVSLSNDPDFKAAMGANLISDMAANARRCLSFELDFDSTIKVDTTDLHYEVHLRAEKLKVIFNPDGTLAKVDTQPLKHLQYDVNVPPVDKCTRTDVHPDGTLVVKNGSLKIRSDIVDVVLYIDPSMQYEKLHYTCPYISQDVEVTWSMPFQFAMIDTLQGQTLVVKDWNYVGNQLFAEAIFEGTKPFGEGEVYNSTFMDLIHVPGA